MSIPIDEQNIDTELNTKSSISIDPDRNQQSINRKQRSHSRSPTESNRHSKRNRSRSRSRSNSRGDKRSSSRDRLRRSNSKEIHVNNRLRNLVEEPIIELTEDEKAMMQVMGFASFNTTKKEFDEPLPYCEDSEERPGGRGDGRRGGRDANFNDRRRGGNDRRNNQNSDRRDGFRDRRDDRRDDRDFRREDRRNDRGNHNDRDRGGRNRDTWDSSRRDNRSNSNRSSDRRDSFDRRSNQTRPDNRNTIRNNGPIPPSTSSNQWGGAYVGGYANV